MFPAFSALAGLSLVFVKSRCFMSIARFHTQWMIAARVPPPAATMSSLARSYPRLARTISTTPRLQNLQPEPQPIPAADALAATAGSPTFVSGEHTSQPSSNAATSGRRVTLAEEQSAREVEEWKVNLRKVREWRRNQGKIRECSGIVVVGLFLEVWYDRDVRESDD